MSTDYRLSKVVSMKRFKAAVEDCGFDVHRVEGESLCITDGTCYLWFYTYTTKVRKHVKVHSATRFGGNYDAPENILEPITCELGISHCSEYDDDYWK